jgi:prolipoprotein diacylglyceryltransferase
MTLISTLFFFAQYFTFYTLLGSLLVFFAKPWLNPWVVAAVQGMAFIVLISIFYIYIVHGVEAVQRFYQRFFAELFRDKTAVLFMDISMHILPVLLVGLPKPTPMGLYGLLIAYGLFIAWFMGARMHPGGLPSLYLRDMTVEAYDHLAFLYLPIVLLLWSLRRHG